MDWNYNDDLQLLCGLAIFPCPWLVNNKYCETAAKFGKIFKILLMLLSKEWESFFKFLWPSQNI